MNCLVSIVVPIYNMEESIEECVKSLLNQSYKNIEIILVDDGSTDNSLEKCHILSQDDNRIKVFHTENCGSGPARNRGIIESSGKYIFFPDADDYLDKYAIKTLVDAIGKFSCDLLVFGFKELYQNGTEKRIKQFPIKAFSGEEVRKDYSKHMSTSYELAIQGAPWNKFFSADIIKKHDVKFPPLRRHQDEAFIARYMCFCEKLTFLDSVLYTHYVNDLKLQWKKYPVDYIDAVIGLNQTRRETILMWNKADYMTKQFIDREYICNVIKALELSFSPKMKHTSRSRLNWIIENINDLKISSFDSTIDIGRYQKIVLFLMKKKNYHLLYCIFWIKIHVELSSLWRVFR